MKNLIAIFFFLVSWNEYSLVPHIIDATQYDEGAFQMLTYSGVGWFKEDGFTVEMTTQTIKLQTKKDVDLFIDWQGEILGYKNEQNRIWLRGIIRPNAFNIKVEEVENE